MKSPEIVKVNTNTIRELMSFLKQARALEDWKERNPQAAKELAAISACYNPALKAADEAVRGRGVSSGPFELYEWRPTVDNDKLFDELGADVFGKLGGTVVPREEHVFSGERFKALVAEGRIADGVIQTCVAWGPRYHGPKPLLLP